jgi:hypothetical protein
MSLLLDMRLREAAKRASRRLRGFDDPAFHTGSEASFYYQFRRVLDLPVIQVPQRGPSSFLEAVVVCRLDDAAAAKDELVDELAELLTGPAVNDAGERILVERQAVSAEIQRMLSIPIMRFYLRAEHGASFTDSVHSLASRVAFPVRVGLNPIAEEPVEQFRIMGLGHNVSCWISYDMLRLVTEHVPIEAYQAEDYVTAA